MSRKYKPKGWRGDPHRHALAAKGIKTKPHQQQRAIFYATKREKQVPTKHIRSMVKDGFTFPKMQQMHPEADHDDLRQRAIRTIDGMQGNSTLSMIDKNGVDAIVRVASNSERKRKNIKKTLNDPQKKTFINEVKRENILENI